VTVAQKNLTLDTPAVTSRPYNGTNAATITGTLNGVVAGDETLVSLVGTGTFADTIPGTHAVTASCTLSGSQADNYTLTQPTGLSGDITSATLTVTPNHVSRAVGAANPSPFPYTITGYQNGENAETANVEGEPILTTDADELSAEGDYTIYCAVGSLAAPHYTFAAVDGTLTVIGSLKWAAGNGVWDIDTSLNWKNSVGTAVRYADGLPTLFDNTATGSGPFTVTLGTIVNPGAITISATNKNYTISGTGQIAGTAPFVGREVVPVVPGHHSGPIRPHQRLQRHRPGRRPAPIDSCVRDGFADRGLHIGTQLSLQRVLGLEVGRDVPTAQDAGREHRRVLA